MSSRQATIGAAVAAALVLGANANTLDQAPTPTLAMQDSTSAFRERMASIVIRSCAGAVVPHATTFTMLEVCGEQALGQALDVFGEVAARLKQL